MKKQIFLVLACLVGTVQAFASGCDPDCCNPCSAPSDCCLDFDSKLYVGIGGGLRWDNIGWKTSSWRFSSDNFHQKWRDIKLGVIEANVGFLACEHYLLKADFDYGWVYGKNHLSTNTFDSSSFLSSSSNFSSRSKNGHAYDLSAGVGYQFNWECWSASFAPLVGYSYNYLTLRRKGFDPYGRGFHDDSSSRTCGNSHKFRLSGPWLGFATTYQATCEMMLYLNYAFHWANFRATVDEGLAFEDFSYTRPHFSRSFKSKNAYGNEVTLGGVYTICDCWYAGLKFNYKNWYTSKKHHSCDPYRSSSRHHASSSDRSRFRNLDWNTYLVTVDIGYTF